jgi:hypothetical protein
VNKDTRKVTVGIWRRIRVEVGAAWDAVSLMMMMMIMMMIMM